MNNFQKTIFALSIGIGFTTFSFAVDQCKGYTSVGNEFPCGNYGNCTWWAAYKRPDLHIIMRRDAKYWFQDALTNNIPTGSEPKVGSIAVFPACGANNAGHVAYVEKINADTFEVSEMNYSENGKYGDGMKTATYKKSSLCGVTGFIYNNLYSEVDGVGSLVDPKSTNEVGGNYDLVAIHPHEKGKRSTAVFQVLADANKCAYVKLSLNP